MWFIFTMNPADTPSHRANSSVRNISLLVVYHSALKFHPPSAALFPMTPSLPGPVPPIMQPAKSKVLSAKSKAGRSDCEERLEVVADFE
jgi:hypothetical protein